MQKYWSPLSFTLGGKDDAEFYQQLTQGQTKAQALRQTMLMTIEQNPEPKN